MDGLILLVLIAALVAFGWTRLRGKMKLSVSGKTWLAPIFIVIAVVLMLWSAQWTRSYLWMAISPVVQRVRL